MQSDYKQIYKLASQKTGNSEQLYKDVGNFVFAEVYSLLRRPKSLIIKLKGIGSWYLRRKRMQVILELHPFDPNKITKNELELYKHENKREIHEIFKERLKEYEKYVQERDQIRKIRYGTQTLLEPTKGED